MAYDGPCMHEFVMNLTRLHHETGVSALDIAKGMLDFDLHPPHFGRSVKIKVVYTISSNKERGK